MTIYDIEWKSSAAKELKRLDRPIIPRIIQAIESLASNPFPFGSRKLKGGEHSYRIRVGDYRIIYTVFQKQFIVVISRIRHRGSAYRT
jgi:mRNA interferase RelE/StbE